MWSKGQATLVPILVAMGVAGIIAVTLLEPIANNIQDATDSFTVTNQSIADADNNTAYRLGGDHLRSVGSITSVRNASYNGIVTSGNYTLTNYANNTAYVNFSFVHSTDQGFYNGTTTPVNVSYTYFTRSYVDDSGARSIVDLIPLFIGLAVLFLFISIIKF